MCVGPAMAYTSSTCMRSAVAALSGPIAAASAIMIWRIAVRASVPYAFSQSRAAMDSWWMS